MIQKTLRGIALRRCCRCLLCRPAAGEEFNEALKDLGSKLDSQNKILQELKAENGETKATAYRYRILRFDDEIRHETRHSKEHFEHFSKERIGK